MNFVRTIVFCIGMMIITSVGAPPPVQDPIEKIMKKFLAGELLTQEDTTVLCQACPELSGIIPFINHRFSPLRSALLAVGNAQMSQGPQVHQTAEQLAKDQAESKEETK